LFPYLACRIQRELARLIKQACRNVLFSQRFLCLSRACLGKKIVFSMKWHRKKRFRTDGAHEIAVRSGGHPCGRFCLRAEMPFVQITFTFVLSLSWQMMMILF
jgi:hypothetical protein